MSSANVHNTEERQKTTNNLNEVRETDLIQLKKMKRWKLWILQPHNKIRVIWDISIIVIIIWNWLYTPFQFAYLSNSSDMIVIDVLDKLFDFLFILDLMFQFLFAYQSPSTGELIDNPKEIAINYIWKGRFFVDLVSSIPIEFILLFINTDGKQLKFIKLFKLIKLFRFGKLMTYLTTRHSIKLSLQMGEILFVLVLCTHWWNWFWYSIVQITETWVPEKDIGFEERNFFSDYTIFGQYILVYYYAISSLIGGDLVPTNQGELLAAMSLVSLGKITFMYHFEQIK